MNVKLNSIICFLLIIFSSLSIISDAQVIGSPSYIFLSDFYTMNSDLYPEVGVSVSCPSYSSTEFSFKCINDNITQMYCDFYYYFYIKIFLNEFFSFFQLNNFLSDFLTNIFKSCCFV